jgi:hypothetical protein
MNWNQQQEMISAVIEKFPQVFGLRAFPGDEFTISRAASYVDDSGAIQLYTYVKRGDKWLSFARGTPAELLAEIVRLDA